ncbi:Hypp4002 [Branchiostoma lanceolatum]|uniref:Hypp4002 protein n=1 Tax=Branchiostoma lanceolatum TaxID=7740 RepID=A0A8K0A3X1_BRALA|nr:Hypp4002 [Branchiostoma lanceolatum]
MEACLCLTELRGGRIEESELPANLSSALALVGPVLCLEVTVTDYVIKLPSRYNKDRAKRHKEMTIGEKGTAEAQTA